MMLQFPTPIHGPTDDEAIAALEKLQKAVRVAFCGVMQSTRLPPMAAMNLAAMAVGSLYVEVAAAHSGANPCPCGWEPRVAADIEAMQSSLALSAAAPGATGMRATPVAGHA
jgi:hypothetical protein